MAAERAGPAWPAGTDGSAAAQFRHLEQLAVAEDHEAWLARTRVFLTPIAAPSIMGLFGFVIGTVMLGSWQAERHARAGPGERRAQVPRPPAPTAAKTVRCAAGRCAGR